MSRVNAGVNPKYLADQHLIAESVEITMITGGLRANKFQIKSEIPSVFKMGPGHINFFKVRIKYLEKRLAETNKEMRRRGFKPGTTLNLNEFPKEFVNDWIPSEEDSMVVRRRISERLVARTSGEPGQGYYRYCGRLIPDVKKFALRIVSKDVFYV